MQTLHYLQIIEYMYCAMLYTLNETGIGRTLTHTSLLHTNRIEKDRHTKNKRQKRTKYK